VSVPAHSCSSTLSSLSFDQLALDPISISLDIRIINSRSLSQACGAIKPPCEVVLAVFVVCVDAISDIWRLGAAKSGGKLFLFNLTEASSEEWIERG
jgi:hypothetical protein